MASYMLCFFLLTELCSSSSYSRTCCNVVVAFAAPLPMELLSPGKDALFLLDESVEPEDDSLEADHMPVNVTTMNVIADASGGLDPGR